MVTSDRPTPASPSDPSARERAGLLAATTALVAAVVAVLGRMRREMRDDGGLQGSTAAAMYGTYAAYVGLLAAAARRGGLPVPAGPARLAGRTMVGAGLAVMAAGMGRFGSPAQVSGLADQRLVTCGIYRYSRNPQYLGGSLATVGFALQARSAAALALAGAYPAITAWWIRIEEDHLEDTFGDAYRRYRAETARWVGRPARPADESAPASTHPPSRDEPRP